MVGVCRSAGPSGPGLKWGQGQQRPRGFQRRGGRRQPMAPPPREEAPLSVLGGHHALFIQHLYLRGTSMLSTRHSSSVFSVAFWPDGTKALSRSSDGTVRLKSFPPTFTCSDGVQSGDESWVDCGGSRAPCPQCAQSGVDCGGSCPACGGYGFCSCSTVQPPASFCGGMWTTELFEGVPAWQQIAVGHTPTFGTGPSEGSSGASYVYTP